MNLNQNDNIGTQLKEASESLLAGNLIEAEKILEALSKSKLNKKQRIQREIRHVLLYWLKDEFEIALRRLGQLIKTSKNDLTKSEIADFNNFLAIMNATAAHHQAAESEIQKAIEECGENEPAVLWLELNYACLLRDRGRWDEALERFKNISQTSDRNPEIVTRSSIAIAELLSDLGRPGVTEWTEIVRKTAPKWGGWILLKLADILESYELIQANRFDEGRLALHQHVITSDELDSTRIKLKSRICLAETNIKIGDFQAALELIGECHEMIRHSAGNSFQNTQSYLELLWFCCHTDTKSTEFYFEALDRVEILLAVVAKYPRPPGTPPYWLQIALLQARLNQIELARRTFIRAQAEAASAGSKRIEATAYLEQAKMELSALPPDQPFKSKERNVILSLTAQALNAAVSAGDIDLEWRIHHLRGVIHERSNEQFLASEEFSVAVKQAAEIIRRIQDIAIQRLYRENPERKSPLERLQPQLSKITISDSVAANEIFPVESRATDELKDIQRLQTIIDSLMLMHSSQTEEKLFTGILRSCLNILEADRALAHIEENGGSQSKEFIKTRSGSETTLSIAIPAAWEREVRSLEQPLLYERLPDENNADSRTALITPLMHRKKNYGFIYVDRPLRDSAFNGDEIQVLKTMVQASSVAYANMNLRSRLADLTEQLRREIVPEFPHIIGQSESMKEVFVFLQKVALSSIPVLLVGETGTGKDLIARTIHDASSRRDKPFVYLDCSSIPETLLEAELFGIEKGIATGVDARMGLLEYANGGTIMLDEVTDIPLNVQSKLLRVFQEWEFEPVGSERSVAVDIRIISTTTKDVQMAIQNRSMREDFYYRIAGITVPIPPLRKRRSDILIIARSFLQKYNAEFNRNVTGFEPEALELLNTYHYPGNVRELSHMIRKAVVFANSSKIKVSDIVLREAYDEMDSLRSVMKKKELEAVMEAVNAAENSKSEAAKLLRISQRILSQIQKGGADALG